MSSETTFRNVNRGGRARSAPVAYFKRDVDDRILDFDARTTTFREIRVKSNPTCALCGPEASLTELIDYEQEACQLQPSSPMLAKG